jgi:hypothetical protein
MQAYVCLRGPDGARHELVHGDLIGRLASAAMVLDDARISEAHAMVSLREGELRMIALRGGLAVDGRAHSEVSLRAGLVLVLARGVELEVERVHLPEMVLGIAGARLPARPLPSVASVIDDAPWIVAGHVEAASAWLWSTGAKWRCRRGREATQPLEPGARFVVGDDVLEIVSLPLARASLEATRAIGGVAAPIRITANFDTVHIHRDGAPPLVLSGVHARIVSELVALDGPAPWKVVAELLWPGEEDADLLRSRFDVALSRLRRRLREARIRTDLVHSNGTGHVELLLYPQDRVDDRT